MSGKVFEDGNDLARNNCEKLYLDSTTADVKFVFRGSNESVPALKTFLSVGSPVFNTMFYGSLPEKGNILIADASPEAFKEFLQFFYLNKVRLSSDNIFEVTNLCKKYEMTEALKRCESAMQKSLTTSNIWSIYAIAKLLAMENVVKYCEQQIKHNAAEILKSSDFSECDQKLLDEILQLVTSYCNASVIVDACMAWAKAECGRNNLEKTSANLKEKLGGSFARIPFDRLNIEQFTKFITEYNGILNESDLMKMKCTLVFDRRQYQNRWDPIPGTCIDNCCRHDSTFFTVNKPILLTEIYCAPLSSKIQNLRAAVFYVKDSRVFLGSEQSTWSTLEEGYAVLKQPILIGPQVRYEVTFTANEDILCSIPWKNTPFQEKVQMRDGYEVNFNNNGPVSRLVFQTLDA